MATYYVSLDGNDSNNGLGPDASAASNKPWRTIAKALGAAGIASGDTLYIGPGVYRERVTVAMTSATAETFIFGDPSNTQGFKNSSGIRTAAGPVVHTSFETSDTAAPSTNAATLNLSARDFLTFQFLNFVGGGTPANAQCVDASTATSTNITFRDCAFFGSGNSGIGSTVGLIRCTNASGTLAYNWLIERCLFDAPVAGVGVYVTPLTLTTGADYDVAFTVRNCVTLGLMARSVWFQPGAGNTFKPGGLVVDCCTLRASNGTAAVQASANSSTTIPCVVRGTFMSGSIGLIATTSGFITSDHNVIACATRYTNVTAGANDSADGALALPSWLGQEAAYNWPMRQPFTPIYGASGLIGRTAGTSPPTDDFTGRARPEGGQSTNITAGALEIHQTAIQETTTTDASGSGLAITGPGSHELIIPVDATSTTLAIRCRYDTNHGATNKPQAVLLAAGQIGVSAETKTATGSANSWETLTFAAFTPSAKGAVRLRLASRSAAGNGVAFFDTLTITTSGGTVTVPFDHFARDGSPVVDPAASGSTVIVIPSSSKMLGA